MIIHRLLCLSTEILYCLMNRQSVVELLIQKIYFIISLKNRRNMPHLAYMTASFRSLKYLSYPLLLELYAVSM